MSDQFDPVWRKVDRAKQHITSLGAAVESFGRSNPGPVIVEEDSEPGMLRARIDGEPKPVPADVPLTLGDAIHNLRTSLDYFACAAVPSVDSGTGFPIWRKGADWKSLVPSKLGGCSKQLRQAVSSLETKPGGTDEYLWLLNELDIVDKHRLLLTVASAQLSQTFEPFVGMPGMEPMEHPSWRLTLTPAARFPLQKDEVLLRERRAVFDKGVQIIFGIAFGEPPTLEGKLLVPVLHNVAGSVESLLRRLIPLV